MQTVDGIAVAPSTRNTLPSDLYLELTSSIRGDLYLRSDSNFPEYTKMFNGDVQVASLAVACPIDAQDVSAIVLFCKKHALSLSVKAGGYGTAGWAIGGDIIVDLSRLTQIEIEAPSQSGGFVSIRDMPLPGSKGKDRAGPLVVERSWSGKRRREADARLRDYSLASHSVEDFLHPENEISPNSSRPANRRRTDPPFPFAGRATFPQLPTDFPVTGSSDAAPTIVDAMSSIPSSSPLLSTTSYTSHLGTGISTAPTSPPSAPPSCLQASLSTADADPFGYLEDGPCQEPPMVPSTAQLAQSIPNSMFATPAFLESPQNVLTYATPIHSHAFVTFGAGSRQKEIDQFSAANPLEAHSFAGGRGAVPYHVPFAAHPTGSAVMLLGGFGFLSRLHGLSVDNLVEAEVVLADGRIVISNEKEHPDLWWALRGAGSAFGIVTRYKARAYPVPVVFAGNLIYRFHRATAPSLIKHFRDCIKGAPRELYANVLLTAGPAGQDSLVVIQMCYVGPKVKGLEFLQAISSWDGEKCLLNEVDEKSFLHQQDSVAQVLRGKGVAFISFDTSLPDAIINKTVMQFAEAPVGCTWLFELAGGAVSDTEDSCLPKVQRQAAFNVVALHQWDIDFEDPRCIESAEEWIAETLAPVTIGGPLPSVSVFVTDDSEAGLQSYHQFLGRYEHPGRVIACFGENWARLIQVKQMYDPANFFRNSFWPLNSDGQIVEPQDHEPEHIEF
ncbi:hypothetical protein ID866_4297 [Astraeus odoratus]|nr:hypothetical protein ID866_4297 [Astraeus odoratus]